MTDNEPNVRQLRPVINGARDARERFLMDAAACRERAIAELKQASTLPTANARRMLESSAASWGARAALLERMAGTAHPKGPTCRFD